MTFSLKTKNLPMVLLYCTWCLALYAVFLAGLDKFWDRLTEVFSSFTAKNSIIATLSPLIAFVLSGLLSANSKAVLVFWRTKDVLPGHRAFTDLAPKDARINIELLGQAIGEFPTEPKEQNSLWYNLYRQHQKCLTVNAAHKHFLLGRDLAAITFIVGIFMPVSVLVVTNNWLATIIYFTVIWAQFLLVAAVARNHGERFVCNVLVEVAQNQFSKTTVGQHANTDF